MVLILDMSMCDGSSLFLFGTENRQARMGHFYMPQH